MCVSFGVLAALRDTASYMFTISFGSCTQTSSTSVGNAGVLNGNIRGIFISISHVNGLVGILPFLE